MTKMLSVSGGFCPQAPIIGSCSALAMLPPTTDPFRRLWVQLNFAPVPQTTGAVPANQPISDGEATDRCKSLRRKMADCPS